MLNPNPIRVSFPYLLYIHSPPPPRTSIPTMAEKKQRQPKSTTMKRSTGKVTRFVDFKGFGFIKPDDGGEDLFVHQSSIQSDSYRTLVAGQAVEFTVASGNNGKVQAIDVISIGDSTIKKTDGRGGSGYRNGGDRRNNGGGCFYCGEFSHRARDCEMKNNGGGERRNNYGGCYTCGNPNHRARDCDQEEYSRGEYRTNGDFNRNNSGDGKCYKCGEPGHYARDCSNSNSKYNDVECYNCGGIGHFSRDCPSGRRTGGDGCYNCGNVGHIARDCPSNTSREPRGAGRAEGAGFECFNCGRSGHFARECPNAQATA